MRDVPPPSSPRPVAPLRERQISRGLVVALAATAGLSAANLYYAQPLLPSIAHALGASESTTGLLVTLTQRKTEEKKENKK
jgi:predicted MFS family arabinose efflux permease